MLFEGEYVVFVYGSQANVLSTCVFSGSAFLEPSRCQGKHEVNQVFVFVVAFSLGLRDHFLCHFPSDKLSRTPLEAFLVFVPPLLVLIGSETLQMKPLWGVSAWDVVWLALSTSRGLQLEHLFLTRGCGFVSKAYLLMARANVEKSREDGATALSIASQKGHADVVFLVWTGCCGAEPWWTKLSYRSYEYDENISGRPAEQPKAERIHTRYGGFVGPGFWKNTSFIYGISCALQQDKGTVTGWGYAWWSRERTWEWRMKALHPSFWQLWKVIMTLCLGSKFIPHVFS